MSQLYLHTVPVKFSSIGAYATWFEDANGKMWPVFNFGAEIYKCIKTSPHEPEIKTALGCPYCDYWEHEYKCGGSCFEFERGGIKA